VCPVAPGVNGYLRMHPAESVVSRSLWARGPKRGFDLLVAGLLLVLLSPVLLVAAVLVKLTSRGPVFFCQLRAGRQAKPFRVRKFRTMFHTHAHDPQETIPLDHAAITPLGRVLRRFKIDEFPQLFSVLSGSMSLIGPRPGLVSQAEAYDDVQRRRLLLRPGCTGLAQVNTMSRGADWTERIRYDVYYVQHCSLWLDLKILAKTPFVLLFGEKRFDRTFDQSPYAQSEPRA
jgi:undecaprenyl phosphate N,N'-diacetylbacillosamine 1-phosphate transferase